MEDQDTRMSLRTPRGLLLLVAVTAACAGTPTQPGGDAGAVTIESRTACGVAHAMLAGGQYADALVELRVMAGSGASGGGRTDVCVARALIGLGRPDDAVDTLASLRARSSAVPDPAWRRSGCLYEAWATAAATADLGEAFDQLEDCERDCAVSVGRDDVVISRDRPGARLLLVGARSSGGYLAAVMGDAEAILDDPTTDAATHRWLVTHLLELARAADARGLVELSQSDGTLGPALAGYARLREALSDGDSDQARALLPDVRARLLALGAIDAAGALDAEIAVDEAPRAPVFGAVLSLSGPGRQVGRAQLAGLLLSESVFDEVDDPESRLLIVDAGETARSAAEAVARLDEAGVLAVVGPFAAELAEAAMSEAEARGVPFVSVSDLVVPPAGARWSVRLFADPEAEADVLVALALDEGLWRVAIARPFPAPPYLEALVARFREQAAAAGIQVTEVADYDVSDLQSEAARLAARLADTAFDALLFADQGANATTLAAYLGTHEIWARAPGRRESGERRYVTFLGTSFWHDPAFLHTGPDYLEGGLFPAWLPSELGFEATRDFVERFAVVYGRRPGLLGAYAHDALQLLRRLVLEDDLRTRRALAEALPRTDLVGAATGEIRFGPDRTSAQRPFVLRVTPSGFEPR